MKIQSSSEMTPYFTITKCTKLFITYLTRSTERLPTLHGTSTISTAVVKTHVQCSVKYKVCNMG